jgi:hypothetical protein
MSVTAQQWNSLIHLKPSDFKYPDRLEFSIVQALDRFISLVGSRPIILSDWRPVGEERPGSQHPLGTATDSTWPGQDPVRINSLALQSGLFSGVGIYWNDVNVASHHLDTRTNRSVSHPATWGAYITHPFDQATGGHVTKYEYTVMDTILEMIKKKAVPITLSLIGFALLLYLMMNMKPGRT